MNPIEFKMGTVASITVFAFALYGFLSLVLKVLPYIAPAQ